MLSQDEERPLAGGARGHEGGAGQGGGAGGHEVRRHQGGGTGLLGRTQSQGGCARTGERIDVDGVHTTGDDVVGGSLTSRRDLRRVRKTDDGPFASSHSSGGGRRRGTN